MRDTTLAKMVARAAATERAESAEISPAASLLVRLGQKFRGYKGGGEQSGQGKGGMIAEVS